MVDEKLTETYHFEVCDKHPDIVWANISRWSTDCPICDIEDDWQYKYNSLESTNEDLKNDLETAEERVKELENALDDAYNSLEDITRTLNQL